MSVNLKSQLNDASPTHIYYDLDIFNTDLKGTAEPPNVVFNEIRNTPYLKNPEDYFASILRFQLDTPSLPVFIPDIEPNQADVNKTIYQISLEYGLLSSGVVNVMYTPTDFYNTFPTSPVGNTQENTTYYYVYNYQHFIKNINTAFQTAFTALSGAGALPTTHAPALVFDSQSKKISLICAVDGYDDDIPARIQIYVNPALQRLLDSLDFFYYGSPPLNPTQNPLSYRLRVYNRLDNTILIPPVGAAPSWYAYKMENEQVDVALWNPVSSIMFTSALLPVVPTNTSNPSTLTQLSNYGNNSNVSNTLTDFEVAIDSQNGYKNTITYVPMSEYRLLDILSNNPLNSIEISVFWKDRKGRLNPFKLNAGCSGNIKLLFRKKQFNNIQ